MSGDSVFSKLSEEDSTWNRDIKKKILEEHAELVKKLAKYENEEKQRKNDDRSNKITSPGSSTSATPNVDRTRGYKLDPNTPIYHGRRNENVEKWIAIINNNLRTAGVPEDTKLYAITNYVKEVALSTLLRYQATTDEKDRNIDDFYRLLLQSDNAYARKNDIKKKIFSLKQTGNFDDYMRKFQELALESDLREEDLITFFIIGLKNRAKFELQVREPKTLSEAYSIAIKLEDSESKASNGEEEKHKAFVAKSKHNEKNKQGNIKCTKCGKQGHYANKCKSEIKCYNCNKFGHYSNECRSNNKSNRDQNPNKDNVKQNRTNDNYKKKPDKVSLCKNEQEKLLVIDGRIDGHYVRRMAFDLGATTSIMSKRIAEKFNFKIIPSTARIQIADNTIVDVIGKTKNLDIDIEGNKCTLSFLVFDHREYDILLGLDYFRKTGAGIFPRERYIQFDKSAVKIPITYEDEESPEVLMLAQDIEDIVNDNVIEWPDPGEKIEIKPEISLPNDVKGRLDELKPLILNNMARNYGELQGGSKIGEFKINLNEDKIIYKHPYKHSEKEKQEMLKTTNELLKTGIVRISDSPYSSPFFMIKKKDGSHRPVIDYRELNKVTVKEDWPIPLIDDILFKMRHGRYFSVMDAKSGFFQIPVQEESKKYTAFSDGTRKLEWNFMPMGVMNAPMVFSRIINQILGDLEFVVVYIDDICIFSNTIDEHIAHIKIVMEKLAKYNIKINPDKCRWFAEKIKLLGYVISSQGIEMDKEKINIILNAKAPTNVKQLQQFVGFPNYYRKLIEGFANIAAPLYNLMRKDVKWEWTKECQDAFDTLKQCMVSQPILRHPDPNKEYFLYTDASNEAMGAILSQKDDDGREHPIYYASKTFRGYEKHMSVSEKEMAAAVFGVKEFRHFLIDAKFTLITDHSALKYLLNMKDPTGKLARWSIYLSQFRFVIVHRKGNKHANADYLSRLLLAKTVELPEFDEEFNKTDPFKNEAFMYYVTYKRHRAGSSRKLINRVEKLSSRYLLENDKLYILKDSKKFQVPHPSERMEIVDKYHAMSAHFGIESTFNRIKENYYWPNMRKTVEQYIKRCQTCIRNDNHLVYNHPAFANQVTGINDEISIDFSWGYEETKDGHCGVMLI